MQNRVCLFFLNDPDISSLNYRWGAKPHCSPPWLRHWSRDNQ